MGAQRMTCKPHGTNQSCATRHNRHAEAVHVNIPTITCANDALSYSRTTLADTCGQK